MIQIKEIDGSMRDKITAFIAKHWGAPIIVTRGTVHYMERLPGLIVMENREIKGLITYAIKGEECEIVSLDSLIEGKGIGSRLLDCVEDVCRKEGCKRLWLITTNDNTEAMRFYQRRGFHMKALHLNAMEQSRKVKPEIPEMGYHDIPIMHEIELEKWIEEL